MTTVDAWSCKDDTNLSGDKARGYVAFIDLPDLPTVKMRAATREAVVAFAEKWAADRGATIRWAA